MLRPRRTLPTPLLLGVAAGCLLPACAPDAVDVQGGAVGELYTTFLLVAAGVFAIVVGLLAWSVIRYRDRPGREEPRQHHGNVKLEAVWFVIPQALVVGLFLLSLSTLDEVDRAPAAAELGVRVQGFQWGWRFSYDGTGVEVTGTPERPPVLVLPVGRDVTFELISNDVIHSFYVPRFLVKRDTIPGKVNELRVTVEEPGTYRGACAEFCGLLHARMDFTVRAVEPDRFETWLDEQEVS
jgi:cytochrome c oxidase subunit II